MLWAAPAFGKPHFWRFLLAKGGGAKFQLLDAIQDVQGGVGGGIAMLTIGQREHHLEHGKMINFWVNVDDSARSQV